MSSWICELCREPVEYVSDRAEERIEYRSADGRVRIANVTLRRLCKAHARSEAERVRAHVTGSSRADVVGQLALMGAPDSRSPERRKGETA